MCTVIRSIRCPVNGVRPIVCNMPPASLPSADSRLVLRHFGLDDLRGPGVLL